METADDLSWLLAAWIQASEVQNHVALPTINPNNNRDGCEEDHQGHLCETYQFQHLQT